MEQIQNLLKIKTKIKQPDCCKYPWQDLAKEIINIIPDAKKLGRVGSVFKCCKINQSAANVAFEDCKELDKLHIMYFLKVFNEINKKQNDKT